MPMTDLPLPSIKATVPDLTDEQVRLLTEREDLMADVLRGAGMQFGAFPEFVAEVIVSIGIGTPPSPEARALIRQQFVNRMAWLQEQFPNTND